jgi:malto-oligosyltrehalose trehalohydrolase
MGIELRGQVIYELHLGTFTPEGTLRAAAEQFPSLAALGITAIEIMPIAEFAGSFGWRYDGVDLFAPTRNYGSPDNLRSFIDAAHKTGLGVILDVVYNHVGPDGNYLAKFSKDYFTDDHQTDWGAAINFDGPNCGPVREFYAANAAYWVREYHFDGLWLDATQNIYDKSEEHILSAVSQSARRAAKPRQVILVGENEPQNVKLIKPVGCGGYNLNGLDDDFHHSARVAITGGREGYYGDYSGSAQELLSAMKYGFLYQARWYPWQKKRRGTNMFGTNCAAMSEPLIARQNREFDGAVLSPDAFVLRFFSQGFHDDRLLVVNLGAELDLASASVPLLGPPENCEWSVQWSTENPRYGGQGTGPLDSEVGWIIPAEAAVFLRPKEQKASSPLYE